MWELLEHAVKNASASASIYATSIHEKAHTLAAAVQDEASTLVQRVMSSARTGPVDEILYEELADYREFSSSFALEKLTQEIAELRNKEAEIWELHDAVVPLELNEGEFWCRYFFRRQQSTEQNWRDQVSINNDKTLELKDRTCVDRAEDLVDRGLKHNPEDDAPPRTHRCCTGRRMNREEHEYAGLSRAADEADQCVVSQWQQKARDLHCQLEETKQNYDVKEKKSLKEWDKQLQDLRDTYEAKMDAFASRVDAAWAAGYNEGAQESGGVVKSVRQETEQEMAHRQTEIAERAFHALAGERVVALTKEKKDLERELQAAREQIAELGKQDESQAKKTQSAALSNVTKERDLWRMRALRMKKLKDLVQNELTTLWLQRDAGAEASSTDSDMSATGTYSNDHSKLQARMNELQAQLANTLANSEARARKAYEKGVEIGKIEAEKRVKQERDVAFQEGYKTAQAEVKSEMGLLKAELGMFRAFHESAIHCADHVDENAENLLDTSLGDILLADGQALCSPTSSVSVFTDDGKNECPIPAGSKSNDDWGEW
uniref:BSD domain-containing protein n=1 Tax=Hyaloperonospora arabidopsidis (strain Emoy2) TaxID=559515 RepID=M4B395_HYAAE